MNTVRRRIVLFVVQFLPLMALFVWLYPAVLPDYERLVLAVVNPYFRRAQPHLEADTNAAGELNFNLLDAGRSPVSLYPHRYRPDGIFFSLVLLPALLLSTPLPIRRRMSTFLTGMLVLFVVHAFALAALLRAYFCLKGDPQSFTCTSVKMMALTSGQSGAIVVWALVTGSYWLPALRESLPLKAAFAVGRNEPCPCGSGKKYKHCCAA